jgi:O-acetylserine/cysteine efflux transporter
VQMIGGLLAAMPNALAEGLPHAPAGATPVLALVLLAFAGTVGPFALFAYGQSRVAPELAGAFLNLEPLVGTAAGALAFGDPFGPMQLLGGAVILAGIALSTTPPKQARRTAAPRGVARRTRTRQAPPSRRPWAIANIHVSSRTSEHSPHHDPPRPPTRPQPDSPHLCGPGGSRAPLP